MRAEVNEEPAYVAPVPVVAVAAAAAAAAPVVAAQAAPAAPAAAEEGGLGGLLNSLGIVLAGGLGGYAYLQSKNKEVGGAGRSARPARGTLNA